MKTQKSRFCNLMVSQSVACWTHPLSLLPGDDTISLTVQLVADQEKLCFLWGILTWDRKPREDTSDYCSGRCSAYGQHKNWCCSFYCTAARVKLHNNFTLEVVFFQLNILCCGIWYWLGKSSERLIADLSLRWLCQPTNKKYRNVKDVLSVSILYLYTFYFNLSMVRKCPGTFHCHKLWKVVVEK